MQPGTARLARTTAAERADWEEPAGQVGVAVQVVLHGFVVDYPRGAASQRVARGVEGAQARNWVETDQAETLMRDKPPQRGRHFPAQFVQWQISMGHCDDMITGPRS